MKALLLNVGAGVCLLACVVALCVTAYDAGRVAERQSRDAVACTVNFDTLFIERRR